LRALASGGVYSARAGSCTGGSWRLVSCSRFLRAMFVTPVASLEGGPTYSGRGGRSRPEPSGIDDVERHRDVLAVQHALPVAGVLEVRPRGGQAGAGDGGRQEVVAHRVHQPRLAAPQDFDAAAVRALRITLHFRRG